MIGRLRPAGHEDVPFRLSFKPDCSFRPEGYGFARHAFAGHVWPVMSWPVLSGRDTDAALDQGAAGDIGIAV